MFRCLLAALSLTLANAAPAQPVAPTPTPLTLRQVVQKALQDYPTIIAAQADRAVAAFDIDRAKAKHYPVIDLAGTRRLAGQTDNGLGPRVRLNIWAAGGIESEIKRETWREQSLASKEVESLEIVAYDAISAFVRVLSAREALRAAQANLERHEALVKDFAAIAKIDTGRRFDVVQATARLEQVRFQMVEIQAELAQASQVLTRYYQARVDPDALKIPGQLTEPAPLNSARLEALVDHHPSVEAARRDLLSARANVEVAKANRGPRLDVESRAGANSYSQLTLSWPAFDLTASAAEDAATAALSGAEALVDEQKRLVIEQRSAAEQAWLTARQREVIASGQIRIAKELVQVYREQFGIGRRNLLDLLNAYAELASAEIAAQRSRLDTILTRYQMEYAIGRLSLLFKNPIS